jgi:hypothetical protein
MWSPRLTWRTVARPSRTRAEGNDEDGPAQTFGVDERETT